MKNTDKSRKEALANLLIRLMVGLVFVSEGLQKLILQERGTLRFEKLGFPYSDFLGPFVGWTELVCGFLVILGFRLRISVVPLFIIILVAIYTTKILPFPEKGIWETLHGSRNDFCVLCGILFLYIQGNRGYALDFKSK